MHQKFEQSDDAVIFDFDIKDRSCTGPYGMHASHS